MPSRPLSADELRAIENIPERYVSSGSIANQVVSNAILSHRNYWQVISESEDNMGGKKPKDPAVLKKAGLGWSANYNHHKFKAKVDQGTNENVGEVMRALAMSDIEFRRPKEDDSEELQFLNDRIARDFVASHITNSFINMLDSDARFSDFVTRIEYNSYTYGYCAVANEGIDDYLGIPLHPLSIAFEPLSKVDDIRIWVIFDIIKADKLWRIWRKIKTQKASKVESDGEGGIQTFKNYWIVEGLEYLLLKQYDGIIKKDGRDTKPESWNDVLTEYIKNPSLAVCNTKDVKIAKIWNREIDGSYTETYTHNENYVDKSSGFAGTEVTYDGLIYQRNWGKIKPSDKICLIRDSAISPDGNIQGLRGIAKYGLENSRLFDRQKNQLLDKLLFAGSPMISQPSTRSGEKFRIGVHQGFSLMPAGYTFPINQPTFDLQPHIIALNLEENHYTRETSHFDPKISNKLSSRPTKDEVQRTSSDSTRSTDAKLNIKFSDYSKLLKEILVRIPKLKISNDKAAKISIDSFYEELRWNLREVLLSEKENEKDEEINEIISSIRHFIVSKVSGDVESIRMALQIAETPFEIRRLERMLLLASGHSRREVNKLKPPLFESQSSYQDERVAAIENDMFWRTQEIVYRSTDDPITHLDMHMSKLNRVFERVKEGTLDAVEAFNYGVNSLKHMPRHIEKLSANPFFTRFVDKYTENFKFLLTQLEVIKDIAKDQAKRIQENQAGGEQQLVQPDAETLAKIQILEFEAVKKLERQDFLTKAKHAQTTEKFQNDQRREDEKLAAKLQRDSNASEVKQRLKVLETVKEAMLKTKSA